MSLHYRVDGDGERAVVLSGSLGSTLAMWELQLDALADFRVVRLDHPGHGGSPVPADPIGIDDLGRAIVALLDELGLERVSFAGLSLGGLAGMWLAARAPERIERIALACTSARFAPPERWIDRAAAVRARGMEAVADKVLERWFTPGFADRSRWREMLLSIPPEGYARCCEVLRDADLRDGLGRIEAPTLVIAGRDDPSVSADETALLVDGIAGARLVELAGAAHLANVERPDAFNAALLDHLR